MFHIRNVLLFSSLFIFSSVTLQGMTRSASSVSLHGMTRSASRNDLHNLHTQVQVINNEKISLKKSNEMVFSRPMSPAPDSSQSLDVHVINMKATIIQTAEHVVDVIQREWKSYSLDKILLYVKVLKGLATTFSNETTLTTSVNRLENLYRQKVNHLNPLFFDYPGSAATPLSQSQIEQEWQKKEEDLIKSGALVELIKNGALVEL